MITAQVDKTPNTHRKTIRWILFLTFIHTIPAPWIYFVIAGLAPTSALLVAGVMGIFRVTEHTPFLALFFLAPALLYCLAYYIIAWLLEAVIIRLRGKAVQVFLVFLICALLLISAFFPIYGTGGHSGTKYVSIIGLWQITRLSNIWLFAYSVLFVTGLSGMLAAHYLDVQLRWVKLRPFCLAYGIG